MAPTAIHCLFKETIHGHIGSIIKYLKIQKLSQPGNERARSKVEHQKSGVILTKIKTSRTSTFSCKLVWSMCEYESCFFLRTSHCMAAFSDPGLERYKVVTFRFSVTYLGICANCNSLLRHLYLGNPFRSILVLD